MDYLIDQKSYLLSILIVYVIVIVPYSRTKTVCFILRPVAWPVFSHQVMREKNHHLGSKGFWTRLQVADP